VDATHHAHDRAAQDEEQHNGKHDIDDVLHEADETGLAEAHLPASRRLDHRVDDVYDEHTTDDNQVADLEAADLEEEQ